MIYINFLLYFEVIFTTSSARALHMYDESCNIDPEFLLRGFEKNRTTYVHVHCTHGMVSRVINGVSKI